MGRPREHDAATRERLLAAAARVSSDEGWHAVTVRRVADEADTSTRAVYSLFGSKHGLEEQLHQAMFERLLELLDDIAPTDDPRADLLDFGLAYRRWATERPEHYGALMRFSGPRAIARSSAGQAAARAVTERLRAAITRGAAAGLFDRHDVEVLVVEWRAVGHGLAEFDNGGLLRGGDATWLDVLGALIDGHRPHG
jgi:AcrR family transcriptional regulator